MLRDERLARRFLAATSAILAVGLILQFILSLRGSEGAYFDTRLGRAVNFFCYFTVLSNIAVAVTTGMLARRLRRSTTFRVFRIVGVVGLTITGIVFHIALADLQELTGWDFLADFLLHTLGPILAPVGWILFGPRRQVTKRIVVLSTVPPICWLVITLVRGRIVESAAGEDYYPYPFLNVAEHGYAIVIMNSAVVSVLVLGICAAMLWLDRVLAHRGIGVDADERP